MVGRFLETLELVEQFSKNNRSVMQHQTTTKAKNLMTLQDAK
jgi:hypothetical protein